MPCGQRVPKGGQRHVALARSTIQDDGENKHFPHPLQVRSLTSSLFSRPNTPTEHHKKTFPDANTQLNTREGADLLDAKLQSLESRLASLEMSRSF